MKAWTIAAVNLRRFARDRTNLFFVFVFPLALVLVIGMQFGGSDEDPRVGLVVVGEDPADAELAARLTAAIEESDVDVVDVVDVDDAGALVRRVEDTGLDAGVVLPAGLGAALAADSGVPVEDVPDLGFVARADGVGPQMRSIVAEATTRLLAAPTAARAAVEAGADPAAAAAAAERLAPTLAPVDVRTVSAGDRLFPEGTGGFDIAAPNQLVLFMFTTGLAGVSALILTRRLGLSSRMLSTPTSARTIILGEALGRLAIGLVQGVYLLVATMLLFGVSWGDPLAASAVLLAFAAVGAGAAMLLGTLLDNEEAAGGLGIVVSMAFAALGGAMLPIELFGDAMARVARATPHYWAIDAFAELIRHDGSVLDIGTQLSVLSAFAAVLLAVASVRMRRVLTTGR